MNAQTPATIAAEINDNTSFYCCTCYEPTMQIVDLDGEDIMQDDSDESNVSAVRHLLRGENIITAWNEAGELIVDVDATSDRVENQ
jgi:hypothetical protein